MGGRKRSKKADLPGVPFELAVAAIQRALDSNATVTHDERIRDRLGHSRQFDVVIRAKVGAHEILGVIECKDLAKRVGTPDVNALANKARNANANLVLIASKNGFTKQALELARDQGIGCISLLQPGPGQPGVMVGDYLNARLIHWDALSIRLFSPAITTSIKPKDPRITFNGESVTDWAMREFDRKFGRSEVIGSYNLEVRFAVPLEFAVEGEPQLVTGIDGVAKRTCTLKRKLVFWSGNGLVDFNSRKVLIPPSMSIQSEAIRSDFADWEIVSEISEGVAGSLHMRVDAIMSPSIPSNCSIDFRDHGTVQLRGPGEELGRDAG